MVPTAPVMDSVELPVRPEDCALFDRAADVRGLERTQFILESARAAATQVILEQTVFECDRAAYDRFVARLDAPAEPSLTLRETLDAPAPWQ